METTEPIKTFEQLAESMIEPEPQEAADETADAPDIEEDQTEAAEAPDDVEQDGVEPEEDSDDSEDDAGSEQPTTYSVKVDGQEVEVTLDDLKRSYSGQQYIQKGMKEAAEAKKQAEAQYQAHQQQQQQLQQLVQFAQQGGFVPPTPPDMKLLQSDPIGYIEAKAQYDQQAAEYNTALQQYQEMQSATQRQQQEARNAYLAEQQALLQQAIPDIVDPEKGPVLQRKIREVGTGKYGFSDDEISSLTDSRMARVLYDAMRYHDLMKNTERAKAKAEKARPVAKAGAKTDQSSGEARKKRDRLRAEGSDEAALAMMLIDQ